MSRPVSHARVVAAIVRKDIGEYARDRLWAFLTVMVLVVVIVLFWWLPNDVDESIEVGIAGLPDLDLTGLEEGQEGMVLVPFATAADLEAVVAGDATAWTVGGETVVVPVDSTTGEPAAAVEVAVSIGIAFPPDFLPAVAAGDSTGVTIFVDGGVPAEVEATMEGLVREMAHTVAGAELPVTTPDPASVYVVLGDDRVGNQATPRDAFRPIFVFLILLMELFVMASLIAKEIQDRTVTAVLVTPATIGDVLAAKGIAGAASGMTQAVIVLVAIDALGAEPVLVLTLMLLGAVMVAGTAMIAGSVGRDFMSTLFYGMAFMVPLMIPAFGALFPGTPSVWIRALPSYPLVDGLVEVSTYGAGWGDTLPQLGGLLAWCVGLFVLGWAVLKRKVATL